MYRIETTYHTVVGEYLTDTVATTEMQSEVFNTFEEAMSAANDLAETEAKELNEGLGDEPDRSFNVIKDGEDKVVVCCQDMDDDTYTVTEHEVKKALAEYEVSWDELSDSEKERMRDQYIAIRAIEEGITEEEAMGAYDTSDKIFSERCYHAVDYPDGRQVFIII